MFLDFALYGCGFAALLVVFAGAILLLRRAAKGQSIRVLGCFLAGLFVVAALVIFLGAGLVFIQPTDRAVVVSVLDNGASAQALQPGLRFVLPFVEKEILYSIAQQTYTMSSDLEIQGDGAVQATTADGETVKLNVSVVYSIDPQNVVDVHFKWGNTYTQELVRPAARRVIRDAVSQFDLEQICGSNRFPLTEAISSDLSGLLREEGLILNGFVLRRIVPCDG